MRSFLLVIAVLVALAFAGSRLFSIDGSGPRNEGQEAAALVTAFGERVKEVSLTADPIIVAEAIRTAYGPYVASELVEEWALNPSFAPGRQAASPYPDRIEVTDVRASEDGSFAVLGELVMLTSTGEAGRDEVAITVIPRDSGLVISAYRQSTP